jgi:hypothetical protein
MDHGGKAGARMRFATEAETLRAQVARLRQAKRPLFLTMEAGALTRWASAIVRPLVQRLIICEPRHNRLINSNPTKSDEADVEGMCLLLRLGKLKEVWMGTDRTREIYRALVYELLNWRDAQRQLKALIKARYRQWGVLKLHGLKVFSKTWRQDHIENTIGKRYRRTDDGEYVTVGKRADSRMDSRHHYSCRFKNRRCARDAVRDIAKRINQEHRFL